MDVLVLGIGNLLLSDEGVGVHMVRALERRWRLPEGVEVVDGGTAGMDLLDVVAGRGHVIVVDAVRTGDPPGTVVELTGEAVPAFFAGRISPHQLGLSDLLAALTLSGEMPRGLTLVGIVPESLQTGLELTPTVAAAMDEALAMVVGALTRLGCAPQRLAA